MRKFLLLIIILIAIAIIFFFISVTQSNTYIIQSNFDNALSSLNKPTAWKIWHPFVKSLTTKDLNLIRDTLNHRFKFTTNADSLVVETINPLLYNVKQYNDGKTSVYAYEIIPSSSTNSITVRAVEKFPLLFFLLPFLNENEGDKGVLALKTFLENDKAFYGYNIQIEKVRDTVFAITMRTSTKTEIFKILPIEFSKINAYIKEKKLSQKNFTSVSYTSRGDSLELILGIPVNKFVTSGGDVKCVHIPKGRMLTGEYEGRFGERQKIYETFGKYVRDHFLENVGAPFESYLNNKLPVSDSDIVHFKLYYPIR
jgi:effector-binding domain-containing protein